ncbi:MAG: hypothetical protein LBQ18_00115 [Campylobacteraceae bacterium]|jgi:hypothetical protein|nr:hypothetical protein [Campylobacteraceae bacterium]
MRKFIKISLLVVVILVALIIALVCGLLFTQIGNNILKPTIEKKAAEASGIDIKLDKFSLRFGSIDVEVTLMGGIKAKAAGDINIFGHYFDVDYEISADKLPQIEGVKLDESLSIVGKAAGVLKFFNIYGAGSAFKSALDFNVTLKDYNPTSITAHINELQISKLLAILNMPIYSEGIISADINITPDENNELFGNAVVSIDEGVVFKDVLQKEFNITLANNPTYKLTSDFSIQNLNEIAGSAGLTSSLADLKTNKTSYNLNTTELKSDYILEVPNLKEFEAIAGLGLQGELKLEGDVRYAANELQLNAKSDNFAGGTLAVKLYGDKLTATLSRIKVEEALDMVTQPNYTSANLDITANFDSISNKSGKIDIALTNGRLNAKTLKKELNVTLAEDVSYKTTAAFKLLNGKAAGALDLASSLANLKTTDTQIDINASAVSSKYKLDIPNLKKLEGLTGIGLIGAASLQGDVKYGKDSLQINANSDNFAGGSLEVKLDNDKFNANLAHIKLAELLKMLEKPSYANADLNIKAQFSSLANKTGTVELDLTNGLADSAVIKKELNITLPKTDFSAKANADIKQDSVNFGAKFLSALLNLEKFNGTFDISKTALKSTYIADIKDLSKLDGITGQKMKGSIAVEGVANYQNSALLVNGKSNTLGGNISFDFANSVAKIDGSDLSVLQLLEMLSYPQIFDAKIKLSANYNTNTSKGNFNATSPSGHITQTQLGTLIKELLNFDLSAETFENILLKGTIEKENIKFLFDATNRKVSLNVPEGKVAGTLLDIPFKLQVEKTDINGKVSGTTEKPKVTIDSSQYLKDKAAKEIDRYLEKNSDKIEKALNKLFK